MNPYRIRAVDGDREFAVLLALQVATLPYDLPSNSREGYWWIAYKGDEPVGFAGMKESLSFPGNGYLCRAGVLEAHRGNGLQPRLLAARERKARELGFKWLLSDTYDNPHSTNNLIKAGFRAYEHPEPYGATGTNYWRKAL